jgi:hypothetical protein
MSSTQCAAEVFEAMDVDSDRRLIDDIRVRPRNSRSLVKRATNDPLTLGDRMAATQTFGKVCFHRRRFDTEVIGDQRRATRDVFSQRRRKLRRMDQSHTARRGLAGRSASIRRTSDSSRRGFAVSLGLFNPSGDVIDQRAEFSNIRQIAVRNLNVERP